MTADWANWLEPIQDLPPEVYCAIGRVDQAWARVDFSLRYLLKNLIRPLAPGDRERIAKVDRHAEVLSAIENFLAEHGHACAHEIRALTSRVGKGRADGAYGQRNDVVHAIYWHHNGTLWRHRIGKDDWGEAFPTWSIELDEVAAELCALAVAICKVGRPTMPFGAPSETAVSAFPTWPNT